VLLTSRKADDQLKVALRRVFLAAAVSVAAISAGLPAIAQDAGRTYRFSLQSQALSSALVKFSSLTGIDVVFDGELPANMRSPSVTGELDARAALTRLLAGTGLSYRITNNSVILLAGQSTSATSAPDGSTRLQPINVVGEDALGPVDGFVAKQSATATKTGTELKKTPQAINVVTRDQMEAQGAATLTQAFKYTPGVVSQFGDDSRYDWFTVRGFRPGRYLDGLRLPFGARGYSQPRIEPYGLERAELLKGPSSVLYGQGEPGGLINMVSKRPTDKPHNEVELQLGTDKRVQAAFDFGGPADEGGALLYRLVGVGRLTDTQYDFVSEKKGYIAPSFTFKPDEGTSLTIHGDYQNIDSPGGGGAPALPANGTLYTGSYAELPRGAFPGQPGFDHYQSEQASIGYEFKHEFNDTWTFKQNLRHSYIDSDTQRVQAVCLAACDPSAIYRYAWAFPETSRTFVVDNQAIAKFSAGQTDHTLLLGADYSNENSRFEEAFPPISQFILTPFNLYDPNYGIAVTRPPVSTRIDQDRNQFGLYAQDQIEWDRFSFSLGGRYDFADTQTRTRTAASDTTVDQNDGKFTWRTGVVYNFDNGISPYAGYSTSFNPAAGTDFAGKPFVPTTGEQFEIGVRYQPEGSASFVSLSAYHLTQENVLTIDPLHTSARVQTGEVVIQGIELEGKAELTDSLSVIASYAYTHSEITKDNPNASGVSNKGNRFSFVPEHQASIWLDYSVQGAPGWDGLSFGGGARYTGQNYGDNANQFDIPAYTVFDAALRYDFGKADSRLEGLKAAINVSNIFDKKYVSTCIASTGCYWGEGRSVYATLKYNW